jgi:hypothetical protein
MPSIISYCIIRNNNILRDGEVIFTQPGIPLDEFLTRVYAHFHFAYPKFFKMDRLCKLGWLASEILLSSLKDGRPTSSTAVVLSNAHSSLDTDLRYWESAQAVASPSLFVYTLPNIVGGEICIRNKFTSESMFFISPMFDAEQMSQYVNLILNTGQSDTCLAGWVDVMGEAADVFLYLTSHSDGTGEPHTATNLLQRYQSWNN